MGAERGTNNTGELNGMGQSMLWIRNVNSTTMTVVILYDSMWAYNMLSRQLDAAIVDSNDTTDPNGAC